MFRAAPSRILRTATAQVRNPALYRRSLSRSLSTAPPAHKSRSWKSSALRWGTAIGAVYFYNTSNVFADEPRYLAQPPAIEDESSSYPTIEEIAAQKKQKLTSAQAANTQQDSAAHGSIVGEEEIGSKSDPPRTPEEYEEEAESQGAFNPETGEINWDCPCLGGMAHGPCGEQFKAAFSCFVYSSEEPKGMDCIDKFKTMQDCFREHPDVYGAELEDEVEEEARQQDADASQGPPIPPREAPDSEAPKPLSAHGREGGAEKVSDAPPSEEERAAKAQRAESARQQVKSDHGAQSEADAVVPKEWRDTTSSNEGK